MPMSLCGTSNACPIGYFCEGEFYNKEKKKIKTQIKYLIFLFNFSNFQNI
jgi:hypothetical protein